MGSREREKGRGRRMVSGREGLERRRGRWEGGQGGRGMEGRKGAMGGGPRRGPRARPVGRPLSLCLPDRRVCLSNCPRTEEGQPA